MSVWDIQLLLTNAAELDESFEAALVASGDYRPRTAPAAADLVESFDTEFNTDFSAKSPNFRGLVLFCIEADFCIQIRILQHFSRSTRFKNLCTAPNSKFWNVYFAKF